MANNVTAMTADALTVRFAFYSNFTVRLASTTKCYINLLWIFMYLIPRLQLQLYILKINLTLSHNLNF
jgi:hypothetical protein